jgi:hypothetical protein
MCEKTYDSHSEGQTTAKGNGKGSGSACFGRARARLHKAPQITAGRAYSTVTDLARLRGWSTSVPFSVATW